MAVIFQNYFLQKEFQDLYRVLLVELNDCGACGIENVFIVTSLMLVVFRVETIDAKLALNFLTQ